MKLLIILSCVICISCGQLKSDLLTISDKHVVVGCPTAGIEDRPLHSFNAMVASLSAEDWVIERADQKQLVLESRKCVESEGVSGDFLSRSLEDCIVLKFEFSPYGKVEFYNPSDRRMYYKRQFEALQWSRELERTFSELRCYSKEVLERRNAETK